MSLPAFDESRFRAQVAKTLAGIRNILDNTRAPQYPADVQHQYDDKYGLAEFLANTAIAAGHECLAQLGLDAAGMQKLVGWSRERNVTLRFSESETCTFLREVTREVESASSVVHESTLFGKSTTKVVTKVTEYFWQFTSKWQISAFVGTGSAEGEQVQLAGRTGRCEIMTSSKSTPRVESRIQPNIDTSLAWLLSNTNNDMLPRFKIDRTVASCRTPRRNSDIDAAFSFWQSWFRWASSVAQFVRFDLISVQVNHGLDMGSLNDEQVFMPVAALFEAGNKGPSTKPVLAIEEEKDEGASSSALVVASEFGSALLPVGDVNRFLAEQRRTLAEKQSAISKTFPSAQVGQLASVVEAGVIMLAAHMQRLAQAFVDGVDNIELMLRRQLVAAVGRELTSFDFAQYMRFHNRKLYREQYEPRPFCYAIRRPDHYPEGTLSIESTSPGDGVAGQTPEPILTHVRKVEPAFPMHFAINAATNVVFNGDRYLHGWVSHQFAGQSTPSLSLNCRARQFSCFLVLVGTIGSASLFLPKHAIIIQNKDDLNIPLNLETLPTAKEFKDAIESMSPEQQRFAKAIRSMQLEGSLFGVCIIQLKPQLEKLLKLPNDSLTKEIRLTQDLLELFIKYQIPSDLLSYEGPESAAVATKLNQVKGHVQTMQGMIEAAKRKEIEDKAAEAQHAILSSYAGSSPRSSSVALSSRSSSSSSQMDLMGSISSSVMMKRSAPSPMMMEEARAPMRKSSAMAPPKPSASTASAAPAQVPQPSKIAKQVAAPAKPVAAVAKPAAASAATPAPVVRAPGDADDSSSSFASEFEPLDWTSLPVLLDKKLSELDTDAALRSTIITAGGVWSKKSQKSILAPPSTASMGEPEQTLSKQEAFDLLDALSRSGVLSIDCAELHIIIATTHCFDKTLIDTVIQANVNPIEKVERSSLLLATTIQDAEAALLIKPEQKDRVKLYNEQLFIGEAQPEGAVVA